MSNRRKGQCNDIGPYEAHCTDDPGHRFSCYDASEDVSFNHRQEFVHACSDPTCPTPTFVNAGD
jgi:hypothetical protein